MVQLRLGERGVARDGWGLPYLIAEAGVNHENDMDNALRMVADAAAAGADAIKFQSYRAESLAARDSPAYWDRSEEPAANQFELFSKHDAFGEDEYKELGRAAKAAGITFASTPFDEASADYLEPLVPFFKVASADLTHHPLLAHLAEKGKPLILSTGAATLAEIHEALDVVARHGAPDVALLHCVLNYPCRAEDANLGMLHHMRQVFPQNVIGFSDHTRARDAMDVLPLAWSMGARIIETHFTFDKTLPGNDHYHALDGADLRAVVDHLRRARDVLGAMYKAPLPSEASARANARRSLVAARAIKRGEVLQAEDLRIKRPGTGLAPRLVDAVAGATALVDIPADAVLRPDMIRFPEDAWTG